MSRVVKRSVCVVFLTLGCLPASLLAGWTFSYQLTVVGVCGGVSAPPLPPIPAAIPTQQMCETLRATVDAISETGCTDEGCCTAGYTVGPCVYVADSGGDLGGTGTGGGTQLTVTLPNAALFPDGSLLPQNQFTQIAGGFYNLGNVSLLGTDYGDASFSSHYLYSTEEWFRQFQERFRLFYEQNESLLRQAGLSIYGAAGEAGSPEQSIFENWFARMTFQPHGLPEDARITALLERMRELEELYDRSYDPVLADQLEDLARRVEDIRRDLFRKQLEKGGLSPQQIDATLKNLENFSNNFGRNPVIAEISQADIADAKHRPGAARSWDDYLNRYYKDNVGDDPYVFPREGMSREDQQKFVQDINRKAREIYESHGLEKSFDALSEKEKRDWAIVARSRQLFDGCPADKQRDMEKVWTLQERYNATLKRPGAEQDALAAAAKDGKGSDIAYSSAKGGVQSHYDCVLYAMANAADEPYSVTSIVALEKIRNDPWRDQKERDNPALALEDPKKGGGGGMTDREILQVGQALGPTEIVRREDIARALEETGKPVFAAIDIGGGSHAIAITKVFEKDGQTYYEVMDSNSRTKDSKTYWKKDDLEKSIVTGGLIVLPEKGTVPQLLREPEKKK